MRILGVLLMGATIGYGQVPTTTLVDQFYDEYFRLSPSEATAVGFHQYDRQMEDLSQAGIARSTEMLRRYEAKFEAAAPSDERDLVLQRIRGSLLETEQIAEWRRNPDVYSSFITESIFYLMSRKFAPAETRLESVISRELLIPRALEQARLNLKNPPRIFTEVALEQLPGIESFFANDVPKAFTDVKDPKITGRFKKSNDAVLASLRSYQAYLKTAVLPASRGDFGIGAENYRKKLLYDQDVDIPLDRLLKIGYNDLRRNQKQLAEVARQIDPHRTTQEIADELGRTHPDPSNLLAAFRDTFASLKSFINEHHIITIPSPTEPILEETPPFMRALTTASMDTPGPYETKAKEAFFNVTLPEKTWSAKETEEYMTAFSRGTLVSTAIHEAYPGHYEQLLWFRKLQSKAVKLASVTSNLEGWAHYTEQMMLDEGYGGGDKTLRFGQLMDALLRDCRYIVGIEMHTGPMTYDQGIAFFMKEAYMTRAYSERETKRGTSDPTYLVYTLGKLQILKLREDYRQKVGSAFNLQQFHDDFVKQGAIPVKMIRRRMLGDDSPAL